MAKNARLMVLDDETLPDHCCATCKWGHFNSTAGTVPGVECHRFPPIVAGDEYRFPRPAFDVWCGEWARVDS